MLCRLECACGGEFVRDSRGVTVLVYRRFPLLLLRVGRCGMLARGGAPAGQCGGGAGGRAAQSESHTLPSLPTKTTPTDIRANPKVEGQYNGHTTELYFCLFVASYGRRTGTASPPSSPAGGVAWHPQLRCITTCWSGEFLGGCIALQLC